MEPAPEPKDTTDFQFLELCKVKLTQEPGQDLNPPGNTQRLAVSNKLGLAFAGENVFIQGETSVLHAPKTVIS